MNYPDSQPVRKGAQKKEKTKPAGQLHSVVVRPPTHHPSRHGRKPMGAPIFDNPVLTSVTSPFRGRVINPPSFSYQDGTRRGGCCGR
ncbi:hypothetical protein [Pasteuria penetrans]|uniref:hypothetical protein n=1 Tax=Pasteuria penetrans TaxID=86005 RepID=UPI000FB41351|nr:hypothetical protein [Pasteuria penetrans]